MDQIDELNETLYKAILKSHEISNSFYWPNYNDQLKQN
jgi:hypothetical protein